MHDRASDKPPSVFTRLFPTTARDATVEHLMEDYIDNSGGSSSSKHTEKATQRKGLTHHPNHSISTTATAESKQSGIFRFGKSIASSFNPVNIWRSVQNNWREAREELIQEAIEEEREKQFRERQAMAEEAYAELKRTGQLGALGTQTMPRNAKIYAAGYTSSTGKDNDAGTFRDSAIQLDDARSSTENKDSNRKAKTVAPQDTTDCTVNRGPLFGFKSPSLTNLKKVRSEVHLGSKQSGSSSLSPEKATDEHKSLRKAQSKKDLQKQQKLNKRVSDLEAKLSEARLQLNLALGEAHPLPALPPKPTLDHAYRSRSNSPFKKPFVPGQLPSLPSERILFPELLEAERNPQDHGVSHVEKSVKEPKAPEPSTLSAPTESATSNPPVSQDAQPSDIWTADVEPAPKTRAAPPKKTNKKRKSGNKSDLTYKASAESEDDAEWEAASTPKKKRATAKAAAKSSPKGKKKRDAEPASSSFAARTSSLQTQNIVPDPELAPQSSPTRTSLELTTVEEETTVTTTITTIAINDVPKKPTAFATPSHPSKYRSRSRSREPSKDGRGHSVSPPPGNGYLNGLVEEEVVELVPDRGEVPPLPVMPQGLGLVREEFEWPDDVF
ncbi:hypothetical protein H2201_003787 [Coniosporium apollinis]|uniref:Nuclear RNA binding protein n=1 Tax=Coniosporium apollinis TaxID=61459 RepID=A0ABQ9NXT4_9PEZI|nr:hypothetical protein H2201_003787 [Coniosporium apollinis]